MIMAFLRGAAALFVVCLFFNLKDHVFTVTGPLLGDCSFQRIAINDDFLHAYTQLFAANALTELIKDLTYIAVCCDYKFVAFDAACFCNTIDTDTQIALVPPEETLTYRSGKSRRSQKQRFPAG